MFVARPPAKVNLTLEVVGRRDDGFHELRSTFVRVGLCDTLVVRLATTSSDSLSVAGLPGVPTRGNLVLRSIEALRAHVGLRLPPLEIELDKRIPVAAGLGGGSSDAASALRLAQVAWGIALSQPEELALGLGVGSDVPFFLADCAAATVEGRGELVTPAEPPVEALVLVTPPIEVSSGAVFATWDDLGAPASAPNDLWPAASLLEPSLTALRAACERATSMEWHMSGSGPTLFAAYASVEAAAGGAQALLRDGGEAVATCQINAVDLVGPDPAWRYP